MAREGFPDSVAAARQTRQGVIYESASGCPTILSRLRDSAAKKSNIKIALLGAKVCDAVVKIYSQRGEGNGPSGRIRHPKGREKKTQSKDLVPVLFDISYLL